MGNGGRPARDDQKLELAILWCRRDLRVTDNPALNAALQLAKRVIPVYIWAPEEEGQFQPGRCSRWWLHQSLAGFKADLQALGSDLAFVRATESRQALIDLVHEMGAQAVVFNHLYDPISLVRDNEVKTAMQKMQVHCQSFNGDVLYEPWEVLNDKGQPFTCFQGFWNRISTMDYPPQEVLKVPSSMPAVPESLSPLTCDDLGLLTEGEEASGQHLHHSWMPGGKGSFIALQKFMQERLATFNTDRAKTDRSSTSLLSPHIHYGELSIRFVYYVVKHREMQDTRQKASCSEFLRQMAFREYSRYLSFHFPFTHERSLLEHLRAAPWKFDHRHFKAWRQGNTGYPMVDASMRQLWSTGWLHNRSRVICASFLVKNLLLPWQWGLKHYWDCLLDADLECAALGWQYCSGCLADAHPFDYMMDNIVEAEVFDPDGSYIRRWLPALARLPIKYIHKPWEAPEQLLADAGVELGVTYPHPVVSLSESEQHLKIAAQVIQQTLAASIAESQVPYRPPSKPSGQNQSSAPQTNSHPKRKLENSQPQQRPGLSSQDGFQKASTLRADEEVVSNAIGHPDGMAGLTANSAQSDLKSSSLHMQHNLGEEAQSPMPDEKTAAALRGAAEDAVAAKKDIAKGKQWPCPPEEGQHGDQAADMSKSSGEKTGGERNSGRRRSDCSGESACPPTKRAMVSA